MNTVTATVNPKKRLSTTMLIAFYAILGLFSTVMAFYDFATDRRFFGILFLIAAIIFFILLLIKGNTVFGTSLKIKGNTLYLKKWDNSFLPYSSDSGIFSDLRPAKTKIVSVEAEDIDTVFVGTKEFIKRNMTESGKRFLKALYPFEHSSKKSKQAMVSGLDIFYAETKNGDCVFMCVHDYSVKNVVAIINEIYNINPEISIRVNNREYKRYVQKSQNAEN